MASEGPKSQHYLRRRSVVSADQYLADQPPPEGVTVNEETGAATMQSAGRRVSVHSGDWIVTDEHGAFPVSASAFPCLYQPLGQALIDANIEAAASTLNLTSTVGGS